MKTKLKTSPEDKLENLLKNNNFRNNQNYIFGGKLKNIIIENKKLDFFYVEFKKYSFTFRLNILFIFNFSLILLYYITINKIILIVYIIFLFISLFILLENTYYKNNKEKYYKKYTINIRKNSLFRNILYVPDTKITENKIKFLKKNKDIYLGGRKIYEDDMKMILEKTNGKGFYSIEIILFIYFPFLLFLIILFNLYEDKLLLFYYCILILIYLIVIWKIIGQLEKKLSQFLMKRYFKKLNIENYLDINNGDRTFYVNIDNFIINKK